MLKKVKKAAAPVVLAAAMMSPYLTQSAAVVLAAEGDSTDTTVLNDTTKSGDDYIGVLDNTSGASKCTGGSSSLTGMDAKVFQEVESTLDLSSTENMNADGSGKKTKRELTCVQSLGFTTDVTQLTEEVTQKDQNGNEITEENPVRQTAWIAWFKNDKDEEADRTQDKGNYTGFDKAKAAAWNQFPDALKKINNNALPETADHTYPTVTPGTQKLDFWSDIPGYYEVLGDLQYAGIQLESYQHFAYTIKETTTTYTVTVEPQSDHSDMPSSPQAYPSSSSAGGGSGGGGYGGGGSVNSNDKDREEASKSVVCESRDFGCWINGWGRSADFLNPENRALGRAMTNYALYRSLDYSGPTSSTGAYLASDLDPNTTKLANNRVAIKDGALVSMNDESGSSCRDEGYLNSGDLVMKITSCDNVTTENKTEKVKVASAVVGAGNYATEIAGFETLTLTAGNMGRVTGQLEKTPFWGTTKPYYWTDEGRYYIDNDSSLPYHFDLESIAGTGPNTVNPYGAIVDISDNLFSLINGNSDITQVPGVGKNDYPKGQPRACIETNGIETCSTAKTPLTMVELDIANGKNPQELVEAEKFVHHTDYYDDGDESSSNSSGSSSNDNFSGSSSNSSNDSSDDSSSTKKDRPNVPALMLPEAKDEANSSGNSTSDSNSSGNNSNSNPSNNEVSVPDYIDPDVAEELKKAQEANPNFEYWFVDLS